MRDVEAEGLLVGYGAGAESAVTPPVTFAVPAGAKFAIVGANGTGKSTLLKALVGQLQPLAGTLRVFGSEVDERTASFRRDVAAVFDDDAYLPVLSVREHLTLIARAHGNDQPDAQVTDILTEFGLGARADAPPPALSSGQRRRLLLAAGFLRPRRLLVLDEPEQRLDAGMREALGARIAAERATVILASHDPTLVRQCATGALVLSDTEVRLTSAAGGADALERLA